MCNKLGILKVSRVSVFQVYELLHKNYVEDDDAMFR